MKSDYAVLEKILGEMLLASKTEEEQRFWASCLVMLWMNKILERALSRLGMTIDRLTKT